MIPLATTTIAVLRAPIDAPDTDEDYLDPYDVQPARETVASGVRARIGRPSAREQVAGGTQAVAELMLWCDPITVGLQATDQILDEQTGVTYEVDGEPFQQRGLNLDHHVVGLKQVVGVV